MNPLCAAHLLEIQIGVLDSPGSSSRVESQQYRNVKTQYWHYKSIVVAKRR